MNGCLKNSKQKKPEAAKGAGLKRGMAKALPAAARAFGLAGAKESGTISPNAQIYSASAFTQA